MKKEKAHSRYFFSLEELQEQALRAWKTYAKEYRSLVPEYQRLLSEKRRMKDTVWGCRNMTLHKIKKSTINDLVHIPLFDLKKESDAVVFINSLNYIELTRLIATITTALDSYSYKTIRCRIMDYKYEIENYGKKKTFGVDPNYPRTLGPRTRRRGHMTEE